MFTNLRTDPESEANTDNWRGGGVGRGQGRAGQQEGQSCR